MADYEGVTLDRATVREIVERQGGQLEVVRAREGLGVPVVEIEGEWYAIGDATEEGLVVGTKLRVDFENERYRFREEDGITYVTSSEAGGILTAFPWREVQDEVIVKIWGRLYRFRGDTPWEDEGRMVIEEHPNTASGFAKKMGISEETARTVLERIHEMGDVHKVMV